MENDAEIIKYLNIFLDSGEYDLSEMAYCCYLKTKTLEKYINGGKINDIQRGKIITFLYVEIESMKKDILEIGQ